MKHKTLMVAAGALLAAAQVQGAGSGLGSETRELRRDGWARPLAAPAGEVARAAAPAAAAGVNADVYVGLAYTNGADASAWNTPAGVAFSIPGQAWGWSVSTLGYERDAFPEAHASGWTDVKFKLTRAFAVGQVSVVPGLALRAPARGAVGSKQWQQELSLTLRSSADGWNYGLGGALKHNAGGGSNPRYASLSVGRDWDGGRRRLSVLLDRLVVPGRAGISTAALGYDFPLPLGGMGPVDASLSLSKGIASDHSTGVEFGISRRF